MTADYIEFTPGHFALDVHEIGSVPIVGVSGQPISVIGFQAIGKSSLQNFPQPAANTNLFLSDILPTFTPADFRVEVIMSNSGNFSVVMTRSGNSQVGLLNANSPVGVTLIPGALYIFDVLVNSGDSINFRYSSTGGTIRVFRLQEIDSSSY